MKAEDLMGVMGTGFGLLLVGMSLWLAVMWSLMPIAFFMMQRDLRRMAASMEHIAHELHRHAAREDGKV